mmetsp:Transcript_36025/g.66584  ORF Transcript_36025/g.66584 Transcript_36025/m.66584 type:complete len:260 (-) Transcript_36025:133-912(-)
MADDCKRPWEIPDLSRIPTPSLVEEIQRRLRCKREPERRIVLIGPPGAGKGTQAPLLAKEYCICRVATGDLLREAIVSSSPIAKKAREAMDAGELVGDDVVIDLLKEKLKQPQCRRGFVLDGFPRTVNQARKLDEMLGQSNKNLDNAVELKVGKRTIIERISGRLIHRKSGRAYHPKFKPPVVAGKDDVTGEHLIHRNDDNPDLLRKRYDTYNTFTGEVLKYYQSQSKLGKINGDQPVNSVFSDLIKYIRGSDASNKKS